MAAEKLRKQQSVCCAILVFAMTNRHRTDKPQQIASRLVILPAPTDSTLELANVATSVITELIKPGYDYKKAGIVLSDIQPKDNVQTVLFDEIDHDKHARLMTVLDDINRKQGNHSVVVASAGFDGVKMNRQHLSKNYTTDWNDILTISLK